MKRAILTLTLLAACTPRFDNPTTINDLRLLAIVADPPEVLIDLEPILTTGTLPGSLPTITLTPLVVDPQGAGRPVSYKVVVCGNQPNEERMMGTQRAGMVGDTVADSPCAEDSPVIAEGVASPAIDGTVPFVVSYTPTVDFLIAAGRLDPIGVELGLPITLTFTINAGSEKVVAYKRVLFSRRLRPDHQPNQNPIVKGFFYRNTREEPRLVLDPLNPPLVRRRGELRIAAMPADAEPYPARAFSLSTRQFYTQEVMSETLRYSFYATRGTFSPGSVNNDPSPLRSTPTIDLETTFQAPESAAEVSGPIDVYVVVRDERGGASFTRTRLNLE